MQNGRPTQQISELIPRSVLAASRVMDEERTANVQVDHPAGSSMESNDLGRDLWASQTTIKQCIRERIRNLLLIKNLEKENGALKWKADNFQTAYKRQRRRYKDVLADSETLMKKLERQIRHNELLEIQLQEKNDELLAMKARKSQEIGEHPMTQHAELPDLNNVASTRGSVIPQEQISTLIAEIRVVGALNELKASAKKQART
ncbi:hypothetical protein B0I35DRAFT_150550 [Stachybotrys elegans]|uniref:Uncharacterized protein n=1 Tax=Stachybotrys elegans TaxID=80388 RepID=A0A8K0SEP8_9HYPO|nr:hypothetical protein B0I35DRAFT_150550 [Stachybotrys elegans]